ncbi:YdcF family protein [Acuticoccus sp.]|uniref:YdcF family protein n=1 Tax=Acuticoccus sp. TaxID=1904378 RepID=UPI003B51C20D
MEAPELLFAFAKPANAIYALLVIGLVLAFAGRRLGLTLAAVATVLWGVAAYLPVGQWLLRPLEERFAAPEELGPLDGIIILGGYQERHSGEASPHGVAVNDAAERLLAGAALARRHSEARVVLTDASGVEPSARFLEAMGIARERIVLEGEATSTLENARLVRDLVRPRDGERWALVTSAYHMPRSVGTFRRADWTGLVPVPVDHIAAEGALLREAPLAPERGLRQLEVATREWAALAYYRLDGRTDALLPSPSDAASP